MLSLILQITVASVIFIFIIHSLINFFRDNLTVPKVKDLVNAPSKKYENMYDVIDGGHNMNYGNNSTPITSLPEPSSKQNIDFNEYDLLPKENVVSPEVMKDELKSFFKKQLAVSSNEPNNYLFSSFPNS